jgi:hypothetical protein
MRIWRASTPKSCSKRAERPGLCPAQPAPDVSQSARPAAARAAFGRACASASGGVPARTPRPIWAAKLGMNLQSSTLKNDETGEPFHVQQAAQIRLYRDAWKEAGHTRTPRVSVSRSIFALVDDRDHAYFGGGSKESDSIGYIDDRHGRSSAAPMRLSLTSSSGAGRGRGDCRGRYPASDRPEPAGRRLQRPCHRSDPEACRAGARLAIKRR